MKTLYSNHFVERYLKAEKITVMIENYAPLDQRHEDFSERFPEKRFVWLKKSEEQITPSPSRLNHLLQLLQLLHSNLLVLPAVFFEGSPQNFSPDMPVKPEQSPSLQLPDRRLIQDLHIHWKAHRSFWFHYSHATVATLNLRSLRTKDLNQTFSILAQYSLLLPTKAMKSQTWPLTKLPLLDFFRSWRGLLDYFFFLVDHWNYSQLTLILLFSKPQRKNYINATNSTSFVCG